MSAILTRQRGMGQVARNVKRRSHYGCGSPLTGKIAESKVIAVMALERVPLIFKRRWCSAAVIRNDSGNSSSGRHSVMAKVMNWTFVEASLEALHKLTY